ncbi:MAG: thioredoxin family protein [Bacteroidota bacterium]
MKPIIATDANFDKVIEQSDLPVLVDFSAHWCPPCRAMEPVMEQLDEELNRKALVLQIDVDTNPATTARFGVRKLPTFLFFDKRKPVTKIIGPHPKQH